MNSLEFYKKNSSKLNELWKKIENLGMETTEGSRKRKIENTASIMKSPKLKKINSYKRRTEEKRIIRIKNKRERRKANSKKKIAESIMKREEALLNMAASDDTTNGQGFGITDRFNFLLFYFSFVVYILS